MANHPSVFVFALWVVLGSGTGAAAEMGYEVARWSMNDGVPHEVVQCIQQTADGYLWVGTRSGLVRFDGSELKVFNRANTPEAFRQKDTCISMAVDRVDGSLWIGTREGLLRRQGNGFRRLTPKEGLPASDAWCVGAAAGGGVWAGLGVCLARITTNLQITVYSNIPTQLVNMERLPGTESVLEDSKGRVWLANGDGVFHLDLQSGDFVRAPGTEAIEKSGSRGLIEALDGSIYWATLSGLGRSGSNGVRHFSAGSSPMRALAQDGMGDIWVGGKRLLRFREGEFTEIEVEALADGMVESLGTDLTGNLWMGGREGQGLLRLQRERFTRLTAADGLLSDKVLGIETTPDGALLIATSGGVNRWDGKRMRNVATRKEIINANGGEGWIDVMQEEEDGTIRLLQHNQSYAFRVEGEKLRCDQPSVFEFWCNAILTTGSELWTVHERFVSRSRGTNVVGWTSWHNYENPVIRAMPFFRAISEWRTNIASERGFKGILKAKDGGIWVGSHFHGLYRFDGDRISMHAANEGLEGDEALPLYEDEDGGLWVKTAKGIARFREGRFQQVDTTHGFTHAEIMAMLDDGLGYYWFASAAGILRVAKTALVKVATGRESYLAMETVGPPCTGTSFPSARKSSVGDLWFPTANGLLRFKPWKEAPVETFPTRIETVLVDGIEREVSSRLMIPAGRGQMVSIRFNRPHFETGAKQRFRHRLLGQSESWVTGKGREADFPGLAPGAYEFQVQGEDHAGGWGTMANFRFEIAAPFYKTGGFIATAGTSAIALLFLAHFGRLRHGRELARLERENALSRERERIAADMHDMIGSSLTKIGLQTEIIRQRAGLQTSPRDLEKLSQSVRDAVTDLDEVLWLFRGDENSLSALVDHLAAYAEDFLASSTIRLHPRRGADLPAMAVSTEARAAIVAIIREALNNAVKHAKPQTVWLRAEVVGNHFHLEICDDGQGVALQIQKTAAEGNGLANIRRRIERLQGQFSIERREPQGTRLIACFPLSSLQA